MDPDKILQPYG